jgi:hypothetical protein
MTAQTHPPSVQHISWTPAERGAYEDLLRHLGGGDHHPPCPWCNTRDGNGNFTECERGTALRLALREATLARTRTQAAPRCTPRP